MKLTQYKYYPWIIVVCYSLLGIFFPAAVTQFSMVVEDIALAMETETSVVLLADTVRAVCLVTSMFLSSWVYQRLGLRKTLLLGLTFQILPQFLIPLAVSVKSIPLLYLFKGMQGFNAMAFPLYISTITAWVGQRDSGTATAVFNGSFVAGSGVGAWIAGRVLPLLGWRASFFAIGGICLFFAIPALAVTHEKRTVKEQRENRPQKDSCSQQGNVYASVMKQPITWILILALLANTWVSQAITVDMSVYGNFLGYSSELTGNLMLAISVVTVVSSVLAGIVSDRAAKRTENPVCVRSLIMGGGYVLSAVAAAFLPFSPEIGFGAVLLCACLMMFGASWAGGVFWSLPVAVYSEEDNVPGTAFCSGASNIPNPIAPMVVGVMLGVRGHWTAAWLTCAIVSAISLSASLLLAKKPGKSR